MNSVMLMLMVGLITGEVSEEGAWKKSLDKDNIVIYTRETTDSKFHEFRAEATMSGSIESFRKILWTVDEYAEWMPDCKSAEVIKQVSAQDLTYHMKLKVPFPFANRDIVQQLIIEEEEKLLKINIVNRPNDLEPEEKYVRMPEAEGQWVVQQISDEQVAIEFSYFANPGGDIPAWLVNSFVVKNPHTMLTRIREKMAQ